MKTCIYCGSQNKNHRFTCKQCGASLQPFKDLSAIASDELMNCNIKPRPEPLRGDLIYQFNETPRWVENAVAYGLCTSGVLLIIILVAYGLGIIY